MKILMLPFVFILVAVSAALSQTAQPTPPPAKDDDVVKISTTLIQLDVSATDAKGDVVKDLKAEDFEIYENGEKQKITNFSFVSNVKTQTEQLEKTDGKIPVPVPQAELRPGQIKRTFALVVDDLSLSFQSAYYVRRALKKFVDEQMQPGDLVAIIRTGAGIGALQQFTSDRRQLYAAIEKVLWNPLGKGNIGAFAPIDDAPILRNPLSDPANSEENEESENTNENFENFRESVFATGTLGALKYIIKGMDELPGRKSVILFSDGIRIFQRNQSGSLETSRVLDFLRQLIDLSNRASVVFYTIDARGLQLTGPTAADNILATPERIQQIISDRSTELFDTQQGLIYLAQQTGGFSIINNNDLSGGVRKILDDQSYYLIGYEPDSDTFDPKTRRFNKLEIKIKRKDVKIRYRSGFFNVADETVARRPVNQTPVQQIQNALTSPFAVNDISLRLNTLYGNDANGSFVRSLLHIKAQDLKFIDEADGSKKAVFDVLAVSFGDNGVPIDQIAKTYTLTVKSDAFNKLLEKGFVYQFTFPVKKAGAYQYRVAIRDSQAGKVGSASQFIEVPNLKKNRLTVSGIVLENLTEKQWQILFSGNRNSNRDKTLEATDPMTDTSLRRFKRGTILRYGFEVYNARLDAARKPNLTTQLRVFYEGKLVLNGKQNPLDAGGQTDLQRIKSNGAVSLLSGMQTGDYILQIIVTDNLAKEKRKIASHFVQFEIVE